MNFTCKRLPVYDTVKIWKGKMPLRDFWYFKTSKDMRIHDWNFERTRIACAMHDHERRHKHHKSTVKEYFILSIFLTHLNNNHVDRRGGYWVLRAGWMLLFLLLRKVLLVSRALIVWRSQITLSHSRIPSLTHTVPCLMERWYSFQQSCWP